MPNLISSLQVVPVAVIAALAAGCALILGKRWWAIPVAGQLALTIPWRVAITPWDSSVLFALAAAVLWLWWIAGLRPGHRPPGQRGLVYWAIVAAAGTLAVAFAPQTLTLTVAACTHFACREDRHTFLRAFVALVAIPAVYKAAIVLIALAGEGGAGSATAWFEATVGQPWQQRAWFQAGSKVAFNEAQTEVGGLFYVQILPVAAAAFAGLKGKWWVAPTLVWAGVLCAGNVIFAGNFHYQHSLTMQMAVMIPCSLAAVEYFTSVEEPSPADKAAPEA